MVAFDRTDLNFSLTQIRTPANGRPPCNPNLACGVREVSATHNAGLGSGYQPLHNFTTPSGGDDRLLSDNARSIGAPCSRSSMPAACSTR